MARTVDLVIPFEFYAVVRRAGGSSHPFRCYISEARYDERGSYYCHIDCLEIRKQTQVIYGVDPEQAVKLSFKFLKTMLEHEEITICDAKGEPFILPYWDDET